MIRGLPSFCLCILLPSFLLSQSIVNTVHNLSASGPGTIKAGTETEICIFCHTPHNSSPRKPLWNKESPGFNYTPYSSSTAQAAPGQPDGASVLCLSCHDGTIALGNVLSRESGIAFSGGVSLMPPGRTNLTQDLSDDHPVSLEYNSTLAASDGQLADPAVLTGPVQLQEGKLQCTACHDPHKNLYSLFLTAPRRYSDLCLYCHRKDFWTSASHSLSGAAWNGSGSDPWPHTPFSSVAENACENCHDPHTAGGPFRLMNHPAEEQNCLDCHNGNVAAADIQAVFSRPYRHNIYGYTQVHDPAESNVVQTQHVECGDCHNPHASRELSAAAPNANGCITGVKGVNSAGAPVNPVQYQYELCYRCHADSPAKPPGPTTRQIEQNNVRLEFDPGNPSFHPVESAGVNPAVPSLISPYSESSIIYCTDCHAGDNGAPAGPHGSIYPQIMKYQYITQDNTPESYQAYELCYQCHNRTTITNSSGSFGRRVHRLHIVEENTPCNVCHDPHGISNSQGNAANNTHLLNFDLSVVSPDPGTGQLEFIDLGSVSGRCYLRCHGRNHSPEFYMN